MRDNYGGSVCKQRLELLSCFGVFWVFFGEMLGNIEELLLLEGTQGGRFADPGKWLEQQLKTRKLRRISFTLSIAMEEGP